MEYGKQIYGNIGTSNNGIGNGLTQSQQMGLSGRRLPEKKFRAGGIGVSIWQNVGRNKNGGENIYRTISLERSYTDKNGIWHNANSLRINDLPKAVLLINKAYEYIVLKQNLYEPENLSGVVKEGITEEEIVL